MIKSDKFNSLKLEIVEQLKVIKPEKIILFGSYAYGTPNKDSDLDICIVEKDYKNRWEEKLKISKLLDNIKMPIDILNPKVDEYEFYKNEINSVYYDIDKKGLLLWQNS